MLTEAPVLRLPDFSLNFIVQCDASDSGVGAALLQDFTDGRFPIAYASKKLLSRERNYSVIERECLAIVFAIKKFEKYLYGREFVLHTDHRPPIKMVYHNSRFRIRNVALLNGHNSVFFCLFGPKRAKT